MSRVADRQRLAQRFVASFVVTACLVTLQQFITTLRTGHNPLDPPGVLLQVMPWPAFGKKTDQDLRAIYEYLRAIPSIEPHN